MARVLGTLCIALLLPLCVARADVIPPTAADLTCPRGAAARESGGGFPRCVMTTCASDDECEGGRVCSEDVIPLCAMGPAILTVEVLRFGAAPCRPDGSCESEGTACERSRRCVEPGSSAERAPEPDAPRETEEARGTGGAEPAPAEAALSEPAAERPGCGCRVAATARGPYVAALVLAWLWWRRR